MNLIRLREDLERFEGKKPFAYDDRTGIRVWAPLGHLTVGIGCNLDEPMSDRAITFLYDERVSEATRAASAFLPAGVFIALNDVRAEVLVQMAFQMGEPTLRGFIRFRQAIIQSKHENAAACMMDSKWAKVDSPVRAKKLAGWWRDGER